MLGTADRKNGAPRPPALAPIVLALTLVLPGPSQAAGALPQDGRFVAGAGTISSNGTSLTVNQTSSRGIIDWRSFSIGGGNQVKIANGAGATLNRVTGADPSYIYGSLSGTGSVYLINSQGILIGPSGVVTTGGRFVASTLEVDNDAFMNGGALTFSGTSGLPSDLNGRLINLGKIASSGGDVFLFANGEVDNVGRISAANGSVELAAGQQILLQDSKQSRQVFVQRGSVYNTVVNRGDIEAAQISLQVADGNVYALAGNHSVLRATGTATRDGHVWLVADAGRVWIDGVVEARNADGQGATVDTNAATLRIAGGPTITAGQWNITMPSFTIDALASPVFQNNLDAGTSINVHATGASGAAGDIDVASGIRWNGAASLTLDAYRSLTIEAAAYLKNSGTGNMTLRADSSAIDNGGSITNNGTVDWSTSTGIVSALYDMNGTYAPGKMSSNASWIAPSQSGLLTQITGYRLVNSLTDLENINTGLTGNYALGKDIDASATSNGSYIQIGGNGTPFTGQFDGRGHTVRSLTMTGVDTNQGMFGVLGSSAVVRDLQIEGNVSNRLDSGEVVQGEEGLLASENDGLILRVGTSGSIRNDDTHWDGTFVGGLVAVNHGTIIRSSSTAAVRSGTAGGLVAKNDGLIVQSYATGAVATTNGLIVNSPPGGLVATNYGTIDQSYATGAVDTGCAQEECAGTGGLVGTNFGTITRSYATGAVTSRCGLNRCGGAGGLAALNFGVISQSFSTGVVRAQEGYSDLYRVAGPYGLAWVNQGAITSDVYWNKDASPVPGVGDGSAVSASNGLTGAQMSMPSSFAGYDFGPNGVWAMPANGSHPVLRWQLESENGG
jgi:filamentous hemagglutinin family protein